MKNKLICSSPTKQGLEKMINEFYYSVNYIIKDNRAFNTKLNRFAGIIKEKKNRFYFYL
jgi:hypothetical protein